MLFRWEQKQNHEASWQLIAESENLWSLVDEASKHKPSGIAVSGRYGQSYLQHRVIDESGKSYSLMLDKDTCFRIMGMLLAEEVINDE